MARSEPAIRNAIVTPDATITEGFDSGVMPGDYGERLSDQDLDALVEYLANVAP